MTTDNLTIFGEADEKTIAQMKNCLAVEDGAIGVLCADNHLGYSQPIGAAVAYREHVSPSGVGFDIGCGNKAVLTDLMVKDVDIPAVMDEIVRRISFGIGRINNEPVDHPVLDEIRNANFEPQRALYDLAAQQLGTVGAGNHYVDLFADEEGRLWVGVHFGSRGFGHKTASGFLSLARGGRFDDPASEGEMMSPPVVFHESSGLGQAYIEAMTLAGKYAQAGRDVVCDKVLEILGAREMESVHNHHNFAWREEHQGETWWVIRKGCTPAFPGQRSFVGSTMGEESVILEGTREGYKALFSTVHGAGRVMSRRAAAGKRRRGWICPAGGCDWTGTKKAKRCPKCGNPQLVRGWVQIAPGKIDFEAVKKELKRKGIELRGGAADEAPAAYKRLDEVLADHGDTIRVIRRLRPVGVAMAGPEVYDPYKD